MSRQRVIYKGHGIFVRKKRIPPYGFYAIVYDDTSFNGVAGRVDRDDEGGIETVEQALACARHEIDCGYF